MLLSYHINLVKLEMFWLSNALFVWDGGSNILGNGNLKLHSFLDRPNLTTEIWPCRQQSPSHPKSAPNLYASLDIHTQSPNPNPHQVGRVWVKKNFIHWVTGIPTGKRVWGGDHSCLALPNPKFFFTRASERRQRWLSTQRSAKKIAETVKAVTASIEFPLPHSGTPLQR